MWKSLESIYFRKKNIKIDNVIIDGFESSKFEYTLYVDGTKVATSETYSSGKLGYNTSNSISRNNSYYII